MANVCAAVEIETRTEHDLSITFQYVTNNQSLNVGTLLTHHTELEKRIGFLVEMLLGKTQPDVTLSVNDIGNQKRMQEIARQEHVPTAQRPLRALCIFHMNQKLVPDFSDIPDRQETFDTLTPNPACYFAPHRLEQEECWRIHRQFAFEISPRGKGIDCFRTREALLLGTIPSSRQQHWTRSFRTSNFRSSL